MANITVRASIRLAVVAASLLAGSFAALPTHAAPGGRLGVLPHGYWQCGTPGDAMGTAFNVDGDVSFSTVPNSSYETRDGGGTYLLTDEALTFTRGPLKGRSYRWESANRLRAVGSDGREGRLICNRRAHRGDNPVSGPSATDRD